jgi:hypothetical protein
VWIRFIPYILSTCPWNGWWGRPHECLLPYMLCHVNGRTIRRIIRMGRMGLGSDADALHSSAKSVGFHPNPIRIRSVRSARYKSPNVVFSKTQIEARANARALRRPHRSLNDLVCPAFPPPSNLDPLSTHILQKTMLGIASDLDLQMLCAQANTSWLLHLQVTSAPLPRARL